MKITVQVTINAPMDKVWDFWTNPEHITKWNFASPDWHCPSAMNDLIGRFSWRMEAVDDSMGFDYSGKYNTVLPKEKIDLTLDDGRNVTIEFKEEQEGIILTETFEADPEGDLEMQRMGWQAILQNFKSHCER